MEYGQALRQYLEDVLHYREGGAGMERAAGTHSTHALPDIIAAHHETLGTLLADATSHEERRRTVDAAGRFMAHVLSTPEFAPHGIEREAFRKVAQLAEMLSHEIRTPLTSVLASAGMLDEVVGPEIGEQERKLLANVLEGAERIKQQTDDLMDLIGLQSGDVAVQLRKVDISALLSDVFGRLQKARPQAELCLESGIPKECVVDPHRLEQVITNLVQQAIRANSGAQRVEVRVYGEGDDDLTVEVTNGGSDKRTNSNGGEPQVLEVDARLGRYASGARLSLSLCHRIVAAHGGRLWQKRMNDNGSATGFTIPCR